SVVGPPAAGQGPAQADSEAQPRPRAARRPSSKHELRLQSLITHGALLSWISDATLFPSGRARPVASCGEGVRGGTPNVTGATATFCRAETGELHLTKTNAEEKQAAVAFARSVRLWEIASPSFECCASESSPASTSTEAGSRRASGSRNFATQ